MPEIHFYCVICGKELVAESDRLAAVTECPGCERVVPVPSLITVRGMTATPIGAFPPGVLAMEIKFGCHACETRLIIDARWEGRAVNCPKCNASTTVPVWSANPPGATQSPTLSVFLTPAEIEFLSGNAEPVVLPRLAS